MQLRIRSIETIPVRVTLEKLYRGSHYQMPRRCTIITRVVTEEGIVGESYNADADEEQPRSCGSSTTSWPRSSPAAMQLPMSNAGRRMRRITFDQLRDRRFAMQAIACVDSAIWDAIGKALQMPLYRLWGGFRAALPMIGIGGYYTDDPGSLEEEVSFFSDEGFVGMKFKIGGRSPAEDAERLARAVEAARPGFVFLVDANQAWTVAEAVEFVNRARDFVELRWFEEPCQWPDDRRAMQAVRFKTGVPVAAGQMEITRSAMRDLMMDEAIDVSNFDASWGGGPDRVAAGRTDGDELRGRNGPSRGGPGRQPLACVGTARHVRRGFPPDPRPDLLEDARQPPRARRRDVRPPGWPGLWVAAR